MTKKYVPRDHKTAPCSSCEDGLVKITRPSRTGMHFCTKPKCQSAKTKFYSTARLAEAKKRVADEEQAQLDDLHDFVFAAFLADRVRCATCGLTSAVQGFVHRNSTGTAACNGTGGRKVGHGRQIVDLVWPDGETVYE
jgi:hypothetical protein